MKATLSDEIASVRQEPTEETLSIATMHKGDEFELGKVVKKKKDSWVFITLDNGVTGYIPGNTRIFAIQKVEAVGSEQEVHESPDENSPILKTIPKKTAFTVRGYEKVEDKEWFVVQDAEIERGYLLTGSKLRIVPEVTKKSARRLMITGAIFTVAGAIAYFLSQPKPGSETTTGDFSFLALGLILLGLFQVVQGFLQHRKAPEEEAKK